MEFISNSRGGRKLCFAGYMYNKKTAQIITDRLMSSLLGIRVACDNKENKLNFA